MDTLVVRGVVTDSATGEPLPAALVRLLEVDRQDVTHENGAFHLRRVPAGSYTLIVEHLGYRPAREPVEVGPGGAPPLSIRLASSAIDLPGIMVTAAMGARSRAEAHRLSQVLGGRELDRELDVTVAETLEGEAGLSSASMGPGPARPVIRGLSGDRILVLEDGERVGDVSSGSADHAVSVEASSARRIEVVRGPAALFYGSNALGGVVNVVREDPGGAAGPAIGLGAAPGPVGEPGRRGVGHVPAGDRELQRPGGGLGPVDGRPPHPGGRAGELEHPDP